MRQIAMLMVASACVSVSSVAHAQVQLRQSTNPSRSIDANTTEFTVPPDVVWKALVQSYRNAGIKVTSEDPGSYRLNFVANPAGAKIGNTKIENVTDCGGDKNSPLARTIPLMVTVRSQVVPKGEGATLQTFVEVLPIAQSGDSTASPTCKSTFALEKKLQPQIKLAFVVR